MFIYWYLLGWRSIVEIIFFSAVFYYVSLWLRRDRQTNLLAAFYGYCSVAFIAYALDISTITHFLFLWAPVTVMLFIMVHHETLQRNFIMMRTITPPKIADQDWLGTLMSSLLTAVNHNKQVICIIEKNDSLSTVLASPLQIHATLQKDLLDILLASNSFDEHKMIWVNQQGQLLGINTTWQALIDETWISDEVQSLETWKQDALLLTNKTDSLVFKITPGTRLFDIVAQKKVLEQCTAQEAVTIIKRYLLGKDHTEHLPTDKNIMKGSYEATRTKHSGNQPLS